MEYSTGLEEVPIPARMKEVAATSLYERLQELSDGRCK